MDAKVELSARQLQTVQVLSTFSISPEFRVGVVYIIDGFIQKPKNTLFGMCSAL